MSIRKLSSDQRAKRSEKNRAVIKTADMQSLNVDTLLIFKESSCHYQELNESGLEI